MRNYSFFFFVAICAFFFCDQARCQQTNPDSVLLAKPQQDLQINPDSVRQDTVTLLEYPAKPYVTADNVDTVKIKDTSEEFSPRKASLYSAILPGLGQAYNEKYWKIPIVYGGLLALGLAINYYDDIYAYYRRNLLLQKETQANETPFNKARLEYITNKSRRQRDYYIILSGLAYLINIVDAHIDAHLKGFDVSDDLGLRLEPSFNTTAFNSSVGGLALIIYIK